MFKRYFILIVFIVLAIVSIAEVVFYAFWENHELRLHIKGKQEHVQQLFDKELAHLDSIATDWCEWDDAYIFVQNKNEPFISGNFAGDETLLRLHIGGMFFFDRSASMVYGRIVENGKEKEISKPVRALFEKDGIYLIPKRDGIVLWVQHRLTDTVGKAEPAGKIVVNKKIVFAEFSPIEIIERIHKPFSYSVENGKLFFPLSLHSANSRLVFKAAMAVPDDVLIVRNIFLALFALLVFLILSAGGIIYIVFIQKEDVFLKELARFIQRTTKNPKEPLPFLPEAPARLEGLALAVEELKERLENEEWIIHEFLDSVPFGAIIYQPYIVYANQYTSMLLGKSPEELSKIDLIDILEEKKEFYRNILQRRLKGDRFVTTYKTKIHIGRKTYYIYAASQTVTYHGNPAGLIVFVDLTKERELQQRFENLEHLAPLVVYEAEVNPKTRRAKTIYVSENITYYTGFSKEALGPNWWPDHLHPDDKEDVLSRQAELYEKGSLERTYRLQTKCGKYLWVRDWVYTIQKESDRIRLLGFWTDETKALVLSGLGISIDKILKNTATAGSLEEMLKIMGRELTASRVFIHCWVGKKEAQEVKILMRYGKHQGYTDHVNIRLDGTMLSKGPTGYAYADANIIGINQDTISNEAMKPWKEEMLKRGFHSSIALRIANDYTLNLYSEMSHIYTKDVVAVLDHLVKGVELAIDRLWKEKKLEELSYYDGICHLPNRNALYRDLEKIKTHFALAFLNIKNFSSINTNYGISFGNRMLCEIANAIKREIKKGDRVYRVEGDRYGILMLNVDREKLEKVVPRITEKLKKGVWIDKNKFPVLVNGGVMLNEEERPEIILAKVTQAFIHGKQQNKILHYEDWMAERSKEYLLHQQILIEAIEKEEFYLFYQPIYNLKQKRFEGVEGLLRILKEDGGYYSPEKIIEAARDLGVQTELTKKILERGLVDLKELLKRFGEMTMAINVLAQDLSDEAFLTYLEELLVKHDLSPRYLALEITEKELISNYEEIKPRLRKIEKMGISIEIDDFGMAHSNFRQVISIDFHLLKIDKSLIDEIIVDAKSSEIVGFLILFARDFGMKSLAEGVETKEQVEILEEMGCDYIQGFYYAKPMPKGDLRKIFVNL